LPGREATQPLLVAGEPISTVGGARATRNADPADAALEVVVTIAVAAARFATPGVAAGTRSEYR
jgi:hypothetical protein